MQFNNSVTRSVAEAARKIMAGETEQKPQELNEELKGDQHKLDVNKNNKLDSEDFEMLRKKKEMKEESELTESHFAVGDKVKCKESGMKGEVVKLDKEHGEDDEKYYTVKREDGKEMKMAPEDLTKLNEESEIEEGTKMQVAQGRTRNVGTYGRAKGAEYGGTDWDKEETRKETKPAKRKYGARQNFVRSTNESFTGLLETYNEGGIKSLLQTMSSKIEEEVDNETFTAELEDQKASMKGKKKQPAVAKASVQAVKVEEEVELEEDTMTHITLGKKVKNSEGGHSQDVHHKGKKIGSIESYKHRGETRYGAFHDASGESTVGSRSTEGAISDLRFHHAQHLKSMKEDVELHEESTYKLGRASAETKDFPIKHKGEHVGTLQFHTSAGKLHHRVSSVIGVSHEKFLNHPDKDNMVNAHVQKHESEARQHFVKKLKEDVELEERTLTEPEMKKKEDVVKGMKKNLSSFKDRYGDRAKEVMYATATKIAKED